MDQIGLQLGLHHRPHREAHSHPQPPSWN